VGRLAAVATLGAETVEGDDRPAAAALLGPVVVATIGQVVGAGGPQEGAEAALGAVQARQVAPLQQVVGKRDAGEGSDIAGIAVRENRPGRRG
jgi:hypothetical protein